MDTIEEADTTLRSMPQASALSSEIQSFSDERSRKTTQSGVYQDRAAGAENHAEANEEELILGDSEEDGEGRDPATKLQEFLHTSSILTAATTIPTLSRPVEPDATKSSVDASARKSSLTANKPKRAGFDGVVIVSKKCEKSSTAATSKKAKIMSTGSVNSEDDDSIVDTSNAPKTTHIPEKRKTPAIASSQSSEDTIANFDARSQSTHTTFPGASLAAAASTSHSHLERAQSSAYPSAPHSSLSFHSPPRRSLSAPLKRKKTVARSEDEYGENELAEEVEKVNKRGEAQDSDFGQERKFIKRKGKAKPAAKAKKPAAPRKNSKAAKAIELEKQKEAEASKQEESQTRGRKEGEVTREEGLAAPPSGNSSPPNSSKSRKRLRIVLSEDDEDSNTVPDRVTEASLSISTLPIPSSVLPASSPPALPLPSTSTTTSKAPVKAARKSKGNRLPSSSQSDSAHQSSANDSSDEDLPRPKSKARILEKKGVVARKSSKPVEDKISAMMLAAKDTDPQIGLGAAAENRKENVAEKENAASDEEARIGGTGLNTVASTSKAIGTPVPAFNNKRLFGARQGTPGSANKTPKLRGLAGVLQKTGVSGVLTPGLSNRASIPRLHMNLKPPPAPRPALPKEKVKKKKGDESYSDEEKPWYKTKHPEDWDSDDQAAWSKIQRRKEMGFESA